MPKTSLFLFSLSFILGLCLGASLDLALPNFLFYLILFIFFLVLKRAGFKRAILCLLIFIIACFYWPSLEPAPQDLELGHLEFEAWICQAPKVSWQRQSLVLCPLNDDGAGKIISWWPLYPSFDYGDQLILACRLSRPEKLEDFNYPDYLARQGIYRQCSFPNLISNQRLVKGNSLKIFVFKFKKHLSLIITRNLPEPAAGLVLAMILGDRQSMWPEAEENFRRAGLSHLTAVSGAHISLISLLFLFLWIYLGASKKLAWLPLLLLMAFYVFLVGARPPAVRALIMSSGVLLAWRLGRLPHPLSCLTAVAALTLMFKPWSLLEIAWQLSFMALLGILLFLPSWQLISEQFLSKLPYGLSKYLRPFSLALGLSFSVQLMIWPLLAWHFSTVSLATLISNLMAFPVFTLIMFLLIPTLFLAWLFPFLAWHLFSPIYFLASYLLSVASLTATWSNLYLSIEEINYFHLISYYGLMFFLFYLKRLIKNQALK